MASALAAVEAVHDERGEPADGQRGGHQETDEDSFERAHAPILTTRRAYAVPVSSQGRSLVIKSTAGTDRPEASNQAFTVAAAAVAAGADVSVWLTGESAWFAVPGRAADLVLEHAT